uniref:Uncharacterized protein n=1 Tax=Glossina brevipalpis TaxID=37001 RepID=A0A1A9WM56_9MUSC
MKNKIIRGNLHLLLIGNLISTGLNEFMNFVKYREWVVTLNEVYSFMMLSILNAPIWLVVSFIVKFLNGEVDSPLLFNQLNINATFRPGTYSVLMQLLHRRINSEIFRTFAVMISNFNDAICIMLNNYLVNN